MLENPKGFIISTAFRLRNPPAQYTRTGCALSSSPSFSTNAIAAFGRECTRRGVPPPTVTIFGSPFITWRGLPLIPSDKLRIDADNKITLLLLHVGESRRGVVGLQKAGVAGEIEPGLSVRCMGTDDSFIASHRHGCEQGERLVICHPRRFK